jgi:hypothetical protein
MVVEHVKHQRAGFAHGAAVLRSERKGPRLAQILAPGASAPVGHE